MPFRGHQLKDDDAENEVGVLASQTPPEHATLKDRIKHFTWPWFAVTMSTGSLAVVLSKTPNRFAGLETIGKVFFVLDVVLFVLFTGLITTRFVLVPKKLPESLHHPVEGLFFGAYWVSAALILDCIQSYGVPSSGTWLVEALHALFWIYCGVALLVGIFQYSVLFKEERLGVSEAMPAWIFPIYPLLVVGPLAATLIPSQPPHAAYPIWVGGVMVQGLAWAVAFMMYTIYTRRLMSNALPHPSIRPGMYVSVGPAGYTSAALLALGTLAPKVLPNNAFDLDSDLSSGSIVKILGIVSGTFILLFSFWFFCISTVAVIGGVKRMDFTLNWWGFVFPNAGLALAVIELGGAFKSPGINGICSALTVMLVLMWLFLAVAHVRAVYRGTILWPGKDEDKDT